MIQINLLPDIKAEYVRAERIKRTVISISIITIIASLAVVGVLSSIAYGTQKLQLNSTQDKIDEKIATIESTEDLDRILTIQNQLGALTPLHESKPVNTRLFNYIQQTTPNDISFTSYSINFDESTISVSGIAPSFESMNRYIDTLKFTYYEKGDGDTTQTKAFTEVVLLDFSSTDFTAGFRYDPVLFDINTPNVKLIVPNTITTRSQVQSPNELFVPAKDEEGN